MRFSERRCTDSRTLIGSGRTLLPFHVTKRERGRFDGGGKEHPEGCALFFMCGVCAGLFLTLFALVVQISCRTDCKRHHGVAKKRPRPADCASDSSDSDSDWDSSSDLSARRHRRFERTLNTNIFTSAEELERAQRLEERERIIREIWMNGQPDVPGTRSLNRYY